MANIERCENWLGSIPDGSVVRSAEPDPLESLVDEHRLIARAVDGLERSTARAATSQQLDRELLRQLVTFLAEFADYIHHEKEETILMPAVLEAGLDWSGPPLSTLRAEHDHERYLTAALRHLAAQLDAWSDYERRHFISVAREYVAFQRQHMATETSLLFPVARERLGPVARQRLRDALARFDGVVQTQKTELQRLLDRVVPEHDEQTVEECGSSPVIAIGVEMQAADALNLADERGIHHLPIVSRGQVVSVICTCDLHELAPTTVVATVAQRPPVAIEAGASCNEAAAMMSASAVGSLLVVQDGAPIGIVTRNDLVRHDVATSYLLEWKCTCCGATRHLHRDRHGLNLCVECLERAESRIECDVGVGD